MLPRRQPVVDYQSENNVTGTVLSVGNIFAPRCGPASIPIHSFRRISMADSATSLLGAVICGAFAHPRRKSQRLYRSNRVQEADGFVDRMQTFPRVNAGKAGKNEITTVKLRTQFFEKGSITSRI